MQYISREIIHCLSSWAYMSMMCALKIALSKERMNLCSVHRFGWRIEDFRPAVIDRFSKPCKFPVVILARSIRILNKLLNILIMIFQAMMVKYIYRQGQGNPFIKYNNRQ